VGRKLGWAGSKEEINLEIKSIVIPFLHNVRAHLQPGLGLKDRASQAFHLNRLSGGAGVRHLLIIQLR